MAIMMLDIDHFKHVNDHYGHKIGDDALAAVAASIKKSLRDGDVAGRYGGEEFIVMVLNNSPQQCFKIAERIRMAVTQQVVQIDENIIQVTISLGLACISHDHLLPVDTLIDSADQALYIAKEQGRNRVVVWTANEQTIASNPGVTNP